MPRVARVEPLTTTRRLAGPFDYALPAEPVSVGSVVCIPLGRQRLLGVVVGLADESAVAPERLVAPLEVLPDSVPEELVSLARSVAREYCSTPARALALVLPPGAGRVRPRAVLVAERAREPEPGERLTPRQRALLDALAAGPRPAAELDHAGLRRLEARGLVRLARRDRVRRPAAPAVGARAARPALTAEQAAALAAIVPGRPHLLHGVTGSGKTEVYLRAAERALDAGRGVLVLVPEIALTPQTVTRFSDRFGATVALLHSGLGEGERYDEWRRLRAGEARIAVGPRSAVFAPVRDLGLVIVDEEHDASYKHEGDPRYDARRVAAARARAAGATLLAGSATPRAESWATLQRITLSRRVDGAPLPPVRVLDMRGARAALHPDAQAALADVRGAGAKAIVLLNRRGWSNFLTCRSCGHAWECPNCDVTLVLHRATARLTCHHCGHAEPAPAACPQCGSLAVARHGAGTERLEHDLAEVLGGSGFPIFRLDADTGAAKDAVARLLSDFGRAPAGVLVGTQMVAKGHDFPDVALGLVVDADATLRFPDFRAEERTFALVAQLAGRAGRGARGGHVLVQTLAPDAPSIAAAARHDSEGFLREELARREALRYPPFADLIRVVCSASDAAAARAAAATVADAVRAPAATVLGPASLFRLRGRERAQVVVKAGDRAAAVAAVGAAVQAAARDRRHRRVAFAVDVDPH